MTLTLAQLQTNVESMLNEVVGGTNVFRFWSANEITALLNEGQRDIARRSEALEVFDNTSVAITAGTGKYALPATTSRVHRVEFVPTGSTLIYPLKPATVDEMDPVWGINQALNSSYPFYFFLWGYPPNLNIQLFPVPSQPGVLNLFAYKQPTTMVAGTDQADVPQGWEDLLVQFCEYRARRKNRDPMWSDVKNEYEEKLAEMIDNTRQWHDQARYITSSSGLGIPSWLYEPSWQ